jgi:hypothetical protein
VRVKVLLLGNSNDTGAWVDPEDKRERVIAASLEAEFGGPVEVAARNLWPNDRMVEYVQRSMDELQPEFVFLNITTFPYSYESTPLRVKRILGRMGQPVGDAGFRLAESKRWSHNAVFRTLRSWAQATIGGDTHFTPEEASARYAELIRVLIRREGTVLAVKGPYGRSKKGITKREAIRHERRRRQVHTQIRDLCQQLHVPYSGTDDPLWKVRPTPRGTKAGDGTHSNAEGHRRTASDYVTFLRETWAAHVREVESANG